MKEKVQQLFFFNFSAALHQLDFITEKAAQYAIGEHGRSSAYILVEYQFFRNASIRRITRPPFCSYP